MATRTRLPHAPRGTRAAASVTPPHRRDALILAGTLVLTILVYAWSLGNGAVVLGDPNTAWYTTPDLTPGLDHAVNLALHLGCVALVFLVVRALTGRAFLAHFCAIAFAVHPMNVDAVAGVDARGILLAALFTLGALLAYVRSVAESGRRAWGLLAIAVALGAAAGLAQVTAAVLPLLLVLVDFFAGRPARPAASARPSVSWWHRVAWRSWGSAWRRVSWRPWVSWQSWASWQSWGSWRPWVEKVPFVAVSAGVLLLHGGGYSVNGALVACAALVTYVWKLFLPVHLALAYSRPAGWFLYAAPVVLILLAAGLLWMRPHRRIVAFGLGFFLLTALPNALLGEYAANGAAYLPYVGLFLVLGHFVSAVLARHPSDVRVQSAAAGLLAGIVLVFSVISVLRITTWHDTMRATTASIGVDPAVASVYAARAGAEYAALDYPAARSDVETALRLDPGNAWAYVYRGRMKYSNSDFTGAIQDFDAAVERAPRMAVAYVDRGRARSANQDSVGALSDFSWAIGLDADLAEAYHQRGIIEIQVSNEKAAVADFDRDIELRPDFADAYYYRGVALARLNDLGRACADLHKAQGLGQKQAGTALSQSCQGK